MAQLGADVEQLDWLARTFQTEASRLDRSASVLRGLVASVTWMGPDAGRFRGQYNQAMAPQLAAIARASTNEAHTLTRQATQQRQASTDGVGVGAGLGGGVGSGGGGGGGGSFGGGGASASVPRAPRLRAPGPATARCSPAPRRGASSPPPTATCSRRSAGPRVRPGRGPKARPTSRWATDRSRVRRRDMPSPDCVERSASTHRCSAGWSRARAR